MEYKVGDIVELKINEEKYKVRITFIYEMNGLIKHNLYDGIILSNKYAITFNEFDILKEDIVKKEESYNYQMVNKNICIGCNHNNDDICKSNKACVSGSAYEMIKQVFKCDKCKNGVEYEPREWECLINEGKTNCDKFESKEVEEKKYLKTWEAIKALEEGYNVKHKDWIHNQYIYKNKEGQIISNRVGQVEIDNLDNEWLIYEEPKKEIPKEFEGLKYILGSINNMDCGEKDCDKCPLGIEKCDMLDEIFFDMKEKYNF